MSNFHAKITYCSGEGKAPGFYLQDVGSTNRTWLRLSAEGEISTLHPLKINDIIKIGSTVFVVTSTGSRSARRGLTCSSYAHGLQELRTSRTGVRDLSNTLQWLHLRVALIEVLH